MDCQGLGGQQSKDSGSTRSPTSSPCQMPEAFISPHLAVTLLTLSPLPVCLSSAASPTSLSPPHHLLFVSLHIPPLLHSLMAKWWQQLSCGNQPVTSGEGASLQHGLPGVTWMDTWTHSGSEAHAGCAMQTHTYAHTHARAHTQDPSHEQRRPQKPASTIPIQPPGFI